MCTRLLHQPLSHQLLVLAAPTKLTFILLLLLLLRAAGLSACRAVMACN